MAFCNELPSDIIPARTEGGPEYKDLDYDPADELSGIPPWSPDYVPPVLLGTTRAPVDAVPADPYMPPVPQPDPAAPKLI